MTIEKEFLSVKEFASLLGVHYNTVMRAIKNGRLNAFRLAGGKNSGYRIPRTEINRIAFCDLEERVNAIIGRNK